MIALLIAGLWLLPVASSPSHPASIAEPPKAPVAPPPPAPAPLHCKLLTLEAPRGGRLEVEGEQFGKTPVVRIGGRIARLLERSGARIAVQIPPDSEGGAVTVDASGQNASCGALVIIGRN